MANKTYNDVQINVKFTKATDRAELDPSATNGEHLAISLGKIAKWYDSLIPTGGSSGKILVYNSSGTAKWNDPLHPTITKSADTTSTASPAHGGTFTTVDSVTRDANGHVTKINTKTVTLPSDQNTDTKVNVTLATTTKAYLLGTSTTPTGTAQAVTSLADTGVYLDTTAGRLTTGSLWSNGDITLYTSGTGNSPAIFFRRGTLIDSSLDWKLYDTEGRLHFDRNISGSTESWENILKLDPTNSKMYFKNTEVSLAGHTHNYVPNTQAGMSAAINLLGTGSSDPQLADYYIAQYAGGGTTTTTYHRRPISALWNTFRALITCEVTGDGNAVTTGSFSNDGNNRKLTLTKGSTFSLSNHTHTTLNVGNKGSATNPVYFSSGAPTACTYSLGSTVNAGTAKRLAYFSGANAVSATGFAAYDEIDSTASTPVTRRILHLFGPGVGNTAAELISGTGGLLSYGDGGPQINFNTASSLTIGGGQDGALIFTDHDTAASGVSWHFVSNQTDWNVISKRFHARTSISIGTNLPNTSYNLYVNGTTNITGATTIGNTTTISTSSFGTQLIVERSGSANMAAVGFKNSSGVLGYVAAGTVDGDLFHYGADTSKKYTILDSNNTSFTRTLTSGTKIGTIKIAGTSTDIYCQTNSNTTYTLGTSGDNVTLTPSSGSVQSITVPYATKANLLKYTHNNEINFSGGKKTTCYFNYRDADTDAEDTGETPISIDYRFCDYRNSTAYTTITAANFAGNASTATKWKTARTLTIGSTGKSVDGSGNVSWSLSEIGAASSSHTHDSLYAVSSSGSVPSTTLSAGQFKVFYNVNAGLANNMPASNNANFIIQLNKHSGNYDSQLGFSSNGNIYYRNFNAETIGSQSWKTILDSGNLEAEARHLDSYSAPIYTSIPINPIAYPLSGFHRSNKLAFVPAANITIEYSTDGGSTWVDYGASNDVKRDLFINKRGSSVNIGPSSGDRTASMMTRVIVETDGRDAVLDRFLIQLDSGYHNVAVDIYVAHVESPTTYTKAATGNATGTWAYEYEINLKHNASVYYRFSNSYYKKIAFYFRYTSVKDSNKSSSSAFSGIMGFTGSYWGNDCKSYLANLDHLYTWDRDQNVTFPANVTATKFTGPLNVSRVTKDSKTFPGANKAIIEEYVGGANYNLPSSQYYHIISIQGPDTKYGTQLALGMTTTGAYYRNYNNQTWSDWKSIINTNTTYTLGTSGNNVTLTPAGSTAQSITVPYATNAANVYGTVTNGTTTTTRYGVVFAADPNTSENNTMRKTYDFRINLTNGSTNTTGQAELVLGNATAKNTADNKQGVLTLYSPGTGYHQIFASETGSAVTHTLPTTNGTILNTGTTSWTQTVASSATGAYQIGKIKINGTETVVYGINTDTNTKVTSSANHYTPSTASGSDKTASASGATAAWGIDVVKGITINTDGKGHITGLSVTSGKIPGNPDTDTKVTQSSTTTTDYRPIALGAKNTTTVSQLDATVTDQVYTSQNFFVKPSTGTLCATEFVTKSYLTGTGADLAQYGLYLKSYLKRADNTEANYADYVVRTYNGKISSNDGLLLTVGGGGLTILGGGESAAALAGLISDDQTADGATKLNVGGNLNTAFTGNSERAIISSDDAIYFITNCQTIANRKPVCLDTNLYFYPGTNDTGSLGTSSYRWNTVYANVVYGVDHKTVGTSHGYYLKDSSGTEYGGVYDNGSNLWIGSTMSTSRHHKGETYISTGWTGNLPTTSGEIKTGNSTVLISVPKYTATSATAGTWDHTPYFALHSGNFTTTGSGNAVTSVAFDSSTQKLTFTKGSTFLTSHQSVSDKNVTLAWGTQKTIATIGSTDIHVTLPSNPNTNTTYTLGTSGDNVTLTPSSGSVQSITVPYATKAMMLSHKTLDSTTINNTAGSFAFSGSGEPWAGTDWVGLQIGDNADKFQITVSSGHLLLRQNDAGGTSTNWGDWYTLIDSANISSQSVNSSTYVKVTAKNEIRFLNETGQFDYTSPYQFWFGYAWAPGSISGTHLISTYIMGNNSGSGSGDNIASVTAKGFVSKTTSGGNGCSMQYNSSTESLDFVFT